MQAALKMEGKVLPFPNKKEPYELTTPDLHRALGQLEGTAKMVQEGLSQVTKTQAETNISVAQILTKMDNMATSHMTTHQIALEALATSQRANSRLDLLLAKAAGAGAIGTMAVGAVWYMIKPALVAIFATIKAST